MTDNKDLKYTKQFETKPFIPQTETRIVLEQQDLYPDLGYEDVGSSKGYGPCFEYNCSCTKQQLREQINKLENKIPYAPEQASFNLTIRMSQARLWNFHFKQRGGGTFDVLRMNSINEAHSRLSQLRSQDLWVCNAARIGSSASSTSNQKQSEVISNIETYVRQYERGQSVNDDITIYS